MYSCVAPSEHDRGGGDGRITGTVISTSISEGMSEREKIFTSSMRPSNTWAGWPGLAPSQAETEGAVSMAPDFGTLPTSTPSW